MANTVNSPFQDQFKKTNFVVMAGPCSIESKEQFSDVAHYVKSVGASVLRGGIFKMRTRPDTFQGVGVDALPWIFEVKNEVQMPLISEVSVPKQIEQLKDVVDGFQVGSRSMYNYELLKELGLQKKPVLLKRAFSAYIEEWLSAAEYIRSGGNKNISLCERGIRTFERATRNTLDLTAVPYIKQKSDLPIIVDPSHGTGEPDLIIPMACAAIAAGADGIMVEVHPNPEKALSDGYQALNFEKFNELMQKIEPIVEAVGRKIHRL